MNKVSDGAAGGGTPKDPPKPNDPPNNPPGDKKIEEAGDNLDELGYEKRTPAVDDKKAGTSPKEGDSKKKDPPAEPEKVANPATGYGDEPPKVDDPPKTPEPPKDPPTDLDKKLDGLNDGFKALAKKQLADLGLEGEKLDKFVELKKQEQKDALDWQKNSELESQRRTKEQNASWHKELREDPAFGRDKFQLNVTRGENVLEEYGPELKKELTDANAMLRPSVMRMLARIADQLHPDDKVVHGDPVPPEGSRDDKDKKLNPLDFYE